MINDFSLDQWQSAMKWTDDPPSPPANNGHDPGPQSVGIGSPTHTRRDRTGTASQKICLV